jgi:protein-S-isoprenylcysteine O-methyltransferase Ste14
MMENRCTMERLRVPLSRFVGILLLSALATCTSVWDEENRFLGAALFFAGCTLAAIGAMGRLWCSFYIAGYKKTELITTGPYSMMRNPLYFFSLVGALGVGLASETLTLPFLVFVGFWIYYPSVIRQEEADMTRIYGQAFLAYCQETPRFLPKVSLLRETQHSTADPIVFRNHILSTVWFIWLIGIFEFMEGLHKAGIVPSVFRIY